MPNVSFQMDQEKVDELDHLITIKQAKGELDSTDSRSDVLRMLVEEYVEGNETSLKNSSLKIAAD